MAAADPVQARNLKKRYGSVEALKGISFEIRRGEMFGLIGPDGAGKTTTIRLLCGLLHPDEGEIRMLGHDPVADHRAMTASVGYLSQRFSLYGDLSIDENIAFFAEIHGVTDYAERRNRLLEMTQLTRFRQRLADKLSGGMKQKLALACTLVHEPDIILLDEPTTGVDPVSRREFWKLLSQFVDQGITILMSTPYLDEAERCHRIALLHEGEVLALDEPGRLRASLPGSWFEVVLDGPRQAAARLDRVQGGPRTYVFGDRLHVWDVRDEAEPARAALDRALAESGLMPASVRPISPSLEDVFIARITREPHRMTRVCLIITLCLAGPSTVLAQPAAVRLTLDDAVSRTFETSHRLAEAQARQEGARATVAVRQAASRPTAAATAGYTRTNHVEPFGFPTPDGRLNILYPDVPDNFASRVAAQWPIYTAGRLDALERSAAAEAEAAGADLDTARADLRFEVTRTYWAVATSGEAVRVLEESVARAEAQVRDARQRLDVGIVPPSDVLTFEAQRASEELQLIEAANLLESTLIDLRRLIGVPPDAAVEIADRLDAAAVTGGGTSGGTVPMTNVKPEGAESATLVAEALKQRPELRALAFRFEGAQAREEAATKGRRPTVALGGGYDFAKPNPKIFPREDIWQTSWDIGLNLNWTFFDSGRTRAEAAEAAAAVRAIEARHKELDTVVSADVRQRLLDLRSGQAAVRASDAGVRAAAEARRVLAERLAVGVATTTDVLVAQEQLLDAELARTRAFASVRLAEARLQRALGRP